MGIGVYRFEDDGSVEPAPAVTGGAAVGAPGDERSDDQADVEADMRVSES
jgi:hypothetical protein